MMWTWIWEMNMKPNYEWSYLFSPGLFEVRAQEYLDSLPGSEQRGVNKFLKGLGESHCTASRLIGESCVKILQFFFMETCSFPSNMSSRRYVAFSREQDEIPFQEMRPGVFAASRNRRRCTPWIESMHSWRCVFGLEQRKTPERNCTHM